MSTAYQQGLLSTNENKRFDMMPGTGTGLDPPVNGSGRGLGFTRPKTPPDRPEKASEPMAGKATPPQTHEPEASLTVNGVPLPAESLVHRWTADELRLPLWLREHSLPKCVAEPAERVFLGDELPAPIANLWAMVHLALAAASGILQVRRGIASYTMTPAVFVQNVVFRLRSARDEVLKQCPPTHVAVVSARLDRLIEATKATLDAFTSEPLDRIWCDNPTCPTRGRHLLPGPWEDALKRSEEAGQEAFRLTTFFDDSTTQPTPTIARSDITPPSKRPVRIAKAARAAGMRSDVLLKAVRKHHYPILGIRGAFEAELDHILSSVVPRKRRQVRNWAEREHPSD